LVAPKLPKKPSLNRVSDPWAVRAGAVGARVAEQGGLVGAVGEEGDLVRRLIVSL